MKLAAVICEFDPFHNGHRYLIEETRRRTQCDGVVCVMSGSFVQRGAPAVCDKWVRTRMALEGGADAVIELPFVYAVSSAQFFALGGIAAAKASGADFVAFGSESGPDVVNALAGARTSPEYDEKIRAAVSGGESYARAASEALGKAASEGAGAGANDVLGSEYIAAASGLGWKPSFCVVTRDRRFMNASGIRSLLRDNGVRALPEGAVPDTTLALLSEWLKTEKAVVREDFAPLLFGLVRQLPPDCLDGFPFAGGGFGRLVYNSIMSSASWGEAVNASTSYRYQSSRASRLMVLSLVFSLPLVPGARPGFPFTEEETEIIYGKGICPYVRVLGAREKILREIASRSAANGCPVVTSPAAFVNGNSGFSGNTAALAKKMLMADVRAQTVYDSVLKGSANNAAARDLTGKLQVLP